METTFEIEQQGKVKIVTVDRTVFQLTDEALNVFKDIHNEWEIDVCEKNPHDALLVGNSKFLTTLPYHKNT